MAIVVRCPSEYLFGITSPSMRHGTALTARAAVSPQSGPVSSGSDGGLITPLGQALYFQRTLMIQQRISSVITRMSCPEPQYRIFARLNITTERASLDSFHSAAIPWPRTVQQRSKLSSRVRNEWSVCDCRGAVARYRTGQAPFSTRR